MIRSIASRQAIASIFTAAWSIFGAQSGYSQPPVEEGKIYWANPEKGIQRSNLDGSNAEQLVIPDLRRPDKIALDIAGGKMYWTDGPVAGIHRSDLDGSNLETIVEGYVPPGWNWITDIDLDVAGGKIYWTVGISHGDYLSFVVVRANLDGSDSEVLFAGLNDLEDSALDLVRGRVYWTAYSMISWADLDGQNREGYIEESTRDITLDVDEGKIYWTDTDSGTIHRADLDGQNVEEVLTVSEGYPEELILLDLDRGKIYWTNPGTQTIQRADLDGQNVEHFFNLDQLHLTGSLAGIALDLDGNKIYWTGAGPEHWSVRGTGTIQRADLDGQNREVLFDPIVRRPHGIALGIDKMYWTDVVKGTIHQADLNGQNREVLITGLNRPKAIALLDGNKLYWAEAGTGTYWAGSETGKIQAANSDGTNVEDLITGLSYLQDIALDAIRGKIYWASYGTDLAEGIIHRADLDGANVEDLITGIAPFWIGIALVLNLNADKLYWTGTDSESISPTIFRSNLDGSHIEKFNVLDWTYSIGALALDPVGRRIYWTSLWAPPSSDFNSPSTSYEEIFRSNLDGSNVEEIRTAYNVEEYRSLYSHSAPTGIALYIPHPTSVSTPSTTPAIPTTSGLDPNFPNPFNANTQIAYRLATPGLVRLEIYNVLGQPVRTLVNQFQPAGFYQVRWDARDQRGAPLAAGVYLTRLRHPDGAQTRRLLYLK